MKSSHGRDPCGATAAAELNETAASAENNNNLHPAASNLCARRAQAAVPKREGGIAAMKKGTRDDWSARAFFIILRLLAVHRAVAGAALVSGVWPRTVAGAAAVT